jgi:hypothetical protein
MKKLTIILPLLVATYAFDCAAQNLTAGAARVDITHPESPAGDTPVCARALVISDEANKNHAVLVTVDAVAVAEIGSIKDPYIANVRAAAKARLGIDPKSIIFNASHCHALVTPDVEARTIQAIEEAWKNRVPVKIGVGAGHEDRIQENRRLKMKDGSVVDVRHAYSMPPDEEVAAVGPIDPEIGILRLDRADNGKPLAVVFNFACHPIQSVPSGGNSPDMSGIASLVIEDQLGNGAVALFVQGCGGDINPIAYKQVDSPRNAEPLGNKLALSTLAALRKIETDKNAGLRISNDTLTLPRADLAARISEMESEIDALLKTLKGTNLNLKTFLPLMMKYHLDGEFPSGYAHRYLQEAELGIDDLTKLDETNRRHMEAYIRNIHTMEELTRKQTNLALLTKHHQRNTEAGATIDVEVAGLRVGNFRMVTFPGEVTVPIGLNIKAAAKNEHSYVAGYSNGYIYYSPTAEQLENRGGAQEDSDCLLAPEWQALFEARAAEVLNGL